MFDRTSGAEKYRVLYYLLGYNIYLCIIIQINVRRIFEMFRAARLHKLYRVLGKIASANMNVKKVSDFLFILLTFVSQSAIIIMLKHEINFTFVAYNDVKEERVCRLWLRRSEESSG